MSIEEWREERKHEFEGRQFGNVSVMRYSHNAGKRVYYLCKCLLCGKEFTTRKDGLKSGHTTSCGCVREKWMHSGQINRKHGLVNDRAYWVWTKVKARCYNPKCREYHNYGGRGIKMCPEWRDDPAAFIKWAYESGYDNTAPKGQCTLDRIDCDGDYEPSNCCWRTNLEQQNNKRCNRVFEYQGERHTIAEWSRKLKISYPSMYDGLVRRERTIAYYINDYVPRKRN
jgi:hypothetical protein